MTALRCLRRCFLAGWLLLAGCATATDSPDSFPQLSPISGNAAPVVRIRLLESQDRVVVGVRGSDWISVAGGASLQRVNLPRAGSVAVLLTADGWRLADQQMSGATLEVHPGTDGVLSVDGELYRGDVWLVIVAPGRFDVVNDLDIDSYLKGVLPVELYGSWRPQTYAAQAVVARTYALYLARTDGVGRYWDLYPDQRSQMYGGLAAETVKSQEAVESTAGLVLTYGPGDGHLFEAYFSSCCGGITQTAALVFPGAPNIPPLAAQNEGDLCRASPNFSWPPVTVTKSDLTRRIRLWGSRQTPLRPEASIGPVYRVDLDAVNELGRPARFAVVDTLGRRYVMNAEEFRAAVNTDPIPGNTLKSSFCKVSGGPGRSDVLFYDGHGSGHGVGMCQWTAEARAEMGMSYQGILAAAFPGAKLIRAY